MDESIVNADDDMELFDPEVLNQVSYGLKDMPYDLSIYNHMSNLAGDNKIENNPVLTNMIASEKMLRFPMLLYNILEQDEHPSIISWCLDSRNFIIYNRAKFEDELMPQYFQSSNWLSFLKQLNVYGFRRALKDRNLTVYCHKDFVQNKPGLINKIKRVKY